MKENYTIDGDTFSLDRTDWGMFNRRDIVFIHGLGESRQCFKEAHEHLKEPCYGTVLVDCIGYGDSQKAHDDDYSIDRQIDRLNKLLEKMGIDDAIVVGHSLGGMLVTRWAHRQDATRLAGIVNVEGNLFPQDASFSRMAVEAWHELQHDEKRWSAWFKDVLMEIKVLNEQGHQPACRRYYEALKKARPEAFLANAIEILERTKLTSGSPLTRMAQDYLNVSLPKLYLWGTESISIETQLFLQEHKLENHAFDGAGHWPMIDQPESFYSKLLDWCVTVNGSRKAEINAELYTV